MSIISINFQKKRNRELVNIPCHFSSTIMRTLPCGSKSTCVCVRETNFRTLIFSQEKLKKINIFLVLIKNSLCSVFHLTKKCMRFKICFYWMHNIQLRSCCKLHWFEKKKRVKVCITPRCSLFLSISLSQIAPNNIRYHHRKIWITRW